MHLKHPLFAGLLVLAALPSPSNAQVIEMEIHLPSEDDPDDFIEIPDGDIRITEFFNNARCECDSPFGVEFFVPMQGSVTEGRPIEIWFGNDCADQELRPLQCGNSPITTFGDRNELDNPSVSQFLIRDLVDPIGAECGEAELESNVYALVDETGDGSYEINDALPIFIDQTAPPELVDPVARGSEGGFVVEWEYPSSRQSDLKYFQVLCSTEDGDLALDSPEDDPEYETPGVLCGIGDATGIDNLDTAFICGTAVAPERSIRVTGLENGVDYRVVLVAIDPSRNPTAKDLGTVTPVPAIDFWEDYKDAGGSAVGGYCSTSGGSGGGTAVLVILALGILGWRRRRARVLISSVLTLLFIIASPLSFASAQQEYLDELTEDPPIGLGESAVKWNMELRFAPYVPDVDGEFSGPNEGPFARMFGDGPMLMTQIALERFFLYPMGQLGVSFNIGFLTTGADVFAVDEVNGGVLQDENGRDVRVKGERTDFRLVPMSVSGVYRFTELDRRWSIPVVPYAKAGLAYYMWSVSRPDGSTAEASTPDCDVDDPNMDCEGDVGRGGSLGLVASLGLALRAERIDADASVSLRNNMGIEHAGFFVELSLAQVDGFGSSSKLSVGDHTVFGGINFEF